MCCISSSPHKEHLLVTGSYDESLRLWDSRKITVPVREVSHCTALHIPFLFCTLHAVPERDLHTASHK